MTSESMQLVVVVNWTRPLHNSNIPAMVWSDSSGGLFYESALIDHENAFRNITKTHGKSVQKRINLKYNSRITDRFRA